MPIWFTRIVYFFVSFALILAALQIFPIAKTISVSTQYGKLLGKQRSGVNAFLGVPFAKPPISALRWKSPQTIDEWSGDLKAFKKSAACLQGAAPNPALLTGESEDCLYLNIWVPKGEGPFPVMVWFHGGGFLLGSGSEGGYDGAKLAKKQQVAVVTANYRLGYQGYLRFPESQGEQVEGNQGYLDQIAAIQWVKDNAASFGIDTDNITIFGESAGSMSVCMLLASPLTNGLINKAIMQSGSCALKPTLDRAQAEKYGLAFLEKIGCKDSESPLSCARSAKHEAIYNALKIQPNEMFQKGFKEWSFTPSAITGTAFLPDNPLTLLEKTNKDQNLALMLGVTSKEGSLFDGMNTHAKPGDDWEKFLDGRLPGLGQQLAKIYPWDETINSGEVTAQLLTDGVMTCPSIILADLWSLNRPVYFYQFNQKVTAPIFELMSLFWAEGAAELGVAHSTEIPYIFGVNGVLGFVLSDEQKTTRKLMQSAWTNFAKTGNPNNKMNNTWQSYNTESRKYLEFNAGQELKENLRREYCEFWEDHPMGF
jgi:para-nitrobenzyl esterase